MYVYDDDIYLSVCGIHITTTMLLLLQLQYVMCLLFSVVQYYVIKSYFLVVVFFWLGQSSSGAICTTIHLFTHVHGIQHHSSSSIYNMYVVLLQERWYTSIYGMVVLFYSSPLFFSSSYSRSPCVILYVVHFLIYHLAQIHFT